MSAWQKPALLPKRGRYPLIEPCEFLDWDTNFFEKRIGRVNGDRLTPAFLREIDTWSKVHEIDCLYFLSTSGEPKTAALAAANGFALIDVRVSLERRLTLAHPDPFPDYDGPSIRPVQPEDVDALAAIARTSYDKSRFFLDPRFPADKCEAFYETWTRNSCNGFADAVFVIEREGLAVGYVTCDRPRGEGPGSIGLVAIAPEFRGRGLGVLLMRRAFAWFREEGTRSVEIVTQGQNIATQRMTQHLGFRTESVMLWYHRWRSNEVIT